MEKITSQKLSRRLTHYGALSAAIAGVSGLNAQEQISYTDIVPDYSGTPNPYYIIDFNGDFTNDLAIFSSSSGIFAYAFGSNKVLGSINSFVASYPSYSIGPYNVGIIYPFALNSDAIISAGQNTWLNYTGFDYGAIVMNASSCSYGLWCDVQDKFIGVQFKIGSNTHYGWARLDIATNGNIWTIKDYAYNVTPNAPILAGQTTSLGVDENTLSKIKIVALHKSIALYNLQDATKYRLFNMTGQEVLKGTTENRNYVIEATALASGIYVVELGDTKSNAIFRKKVVLR